MCIILNALRMRQIPHNLCHSQLMAPAIPQTHSFFHPHRWNPAGLPRHNNIAATSLFSNTNKAAMKSGKNTLWTSWLEFLTQYWSHQKLYEKTSFL